MTGSPLGVFAEGQGDLEEKYRWRMLLLSRDCAPEQDLAHDCLYLIAIYQGGKEARFVFFRIESVYFSFCSWCSNMVLDFIQKSDWQAHLLWVFHPDKWRSDIRVQICFLCISCHWQQLFQHTVAAFQLEGWLEKID